MILFDQIYVYRKTKSPNPSEKFANRCFRYYCCRKLYNDTPLTECAKCPQGSYIICLLHLCHHDNSSNIVRSSYIFGCIDRNPEIVVPSSHQRYHSTNNACICTKIYLLAFRHQLQSHQNTRGMHKYGICIPSRKNWLSMLANICHQRRYLCRLRWCIYL